MYVKFSMDKPRFLSNIPHVSMVYWLNKPRGMLEEHGKRLEVTSRRRVILNKLFKCYSNIQSGLLSQLTIEMCGIVLFAAFSMWFTGIIINRY